MADFHRFKPQPMYRGKNMVVYRESTYPREIVDMMGAPTSFVAYLTEGGRDMALDGADTEIELITELKGWKENKAVYRLIKDDVEKYEQAARQRVRDSVVTISSRSPCPGQPKAKPKAKPAAKPAATKKAKKTAAKPKKTTKKPADRTTRKPKAKPAAKPAATLKLTAAQREYMAIYGFVRVKRGGKYITITN